MGIFSAEGAEGAIGHADDGVQTLVLLLLILPLAGFLLTGIFGQRLGARPWIIAVAAILATTAIATYLAFQSLSGEYGEHGVGFTLYTWIPAGEFQVNVGFFVDNLTALLLILIGGTFPLLFGELDWGHAAIAGGLLFFVRPIAGWFSLSGTDLPPQDRLVVAFYGVRGIGSIYYLAYATSHLEMVNEGQLWATIALTILLSTIVHGFTAGPVVDHIVRRQRKRGA